MAKVITGFHSIEEKVRANVPGAKLFFSKPGPRVKKIIEELGEKPGVIFAVIPDNDSSFNFIIGMVYTQLFQQLYRCADFKYGGALPYHVHFLCDELANCGIPSELEKIFATCRSRNISISAVLQNISQLKALFEKQWESIIGNCDEFLYLGGNEQSTHKYVSELIGKETIDTNSYGQQKGRNGSYSKNDQVTGRDLMTPDEVRRLENNLAILFIRGENPVIDYKYDILRHPNVVFTTDGSGKPYIHGRNYKDATVITLIVLILVRQLETGVLRKFTQKTATIKATLLVKEENIAEVIRDVSKKFDKIVEINHNKDNLKDNKEEVFVVTKVVATNPVMEMYNKITQINHIENVFITNMNFEK